MIRSQHLGQPKRAVLNDEEYEDDSKNYTLVGVQKPYQTYEEVYTAKHTHYYFSEDFVEPKLYTDVLHRLVTANSSDTVFLHVNTSGGRVDTGVQLINAMKNSEAKVVTILEGCAQSLGTLIFLSGDEMIVNDNCVMMFHNFNGGIVGKGNEMAAELEATIKWINTISRKIYVPFLTEDEFSRITKGEDLWMHSPEIRKRLDRMIKLAVEESSLPKPPRSKKSPVVAT